MLLRTGFGRHWPDREKYLGTAERGAEAIAKLSFPGLSAEGAKWLVAEREVRMKLRSKTFLISTGILMLMVLGSILVGLRYSF